MYTDCNIFVIIHSTFGTNACGYEIKTHVNGRKGRFLANEKINDIRSNIVPRRFVSIWYTGTG